MSNLVFRVAFSQLDVIRLLFTVSARLIKIPKIIIASLSFKKLMSDSTTSLS